MKMKANEVLSSVVLLLTVILLLSPAVGENDISQCNAHYASSDDTTLGTIHQYELNYAAVWGDDNHVVQDNDQYAKGIDIDQCAANKILVVGHSNYATQSNHADAPKDSDPGVMNVRQTQSNILAIIGDFNGDQSAPIVQSNDAYAINEATGAWIDQFQSNIAVVLGTGNYLTQRNNGNAIMATDPTEINQIQKNLALLIGTSGQPIPPTPDESSIIKINEPDCFLPDPQFCQSGSC
jgi:hypothetical protein